MKRFEPILRIAFSLLIVLAGVGVFFLLGEKKTATRPPDRPRLPVVETVTAARHVAGIPFEVDGVVVPFRQVTLAAEVSGRILSKSPQCRIGRVVKAGDALITIDPQDASLEMRRLKEELRQADASIGELEAELQSVENQIDAARLELELETRQLGRIQSLLDRQAGSETEADAARRTELATRKALQTLKDEKQLIQRRRIRLESAKALGQANLERAQLNLSRTEIRAPIDAIVVADDVEENSYVQVGSPVVTLQENDRLDVTCKLTAKQMNWLWQSDLDTPSGSMADLVSGPSPGDEPSDQKPSDQKPSDQKPSDQKPSDQKPSDLAHRFPETPVTVHYQLDGVGYQWNGVMDRYDGAGLDPQTRMIPCRVLVDDPDAVSVVTSQTIATATTDSERPAPRTGGGPTPTPPTLMTGMFVSVRVLATPPIPVVSIPSSAVGPGGLVWSVDRGRLQRHQVSVATTRGQRVIVYEQPGGLGAGDAIVVSPIASPVQGLRVEQLSGNAASMAAMP